jgi:hypothetical protein
VKERSIPAPAHDRLVSHLTATTGLTSAEAVRVVEEVVAYFQEPLDSIVRRRHRELRAHGAKNDDIFVRLQHELVGWPVAAPALTVRQLRRIVYG